MQRGYGVNRAKAPIFRLKKCSYTGTIYLVFIGHPVHIPDIAVAAQSFVEKRDDDPTRPLD